MQYIEGDRLKNEEKEKKIFSNKYLRAASVCLCSMILLSFVFTILLLLIGPRLSTNSLFVLRDILIIIIMLLAIVAWIVVVMMGIRIVIYGNEVKHDKAYWEDNLSEQEGLSYGNQVDPYMLPARYSSPITVFVIGFCCFVGVPCAICTKYLHFDFLQIKYIIIYLLIEYVLIMVVVKIARLFRHFRTFQVKIYKKHSGGE